MTSPATDARVLDWLTEAQRLLARLGETQAGAIAEASAWCADAIAGGGLVHLFGTGHSRIPVEEMFPRYGSYPGFNPIVELSMTFHTQVVGANGQRQAMYIERMPGLAEVILSNFAFGPTRRDDRLLGERALGGAGRDGPRRPAARPPGHRRDVRRAVAWRTSPSPLVGSRLLDEADLVIDLCTPHADALVAIDGLDTPVGPGSTIAAVAIVNCHQGRGPRSCSSSAARCRRSSPGRRSSAPSARGSCSTTPIESMRGASLVPSASEG